MKLPIHTDVIMWLLQRKGQNKILVNRESILDQSEMTELLKSCWKLVSKGQLILRLVLIVHLICFSWKIKSSADAYAQFIYNGCNELQLVYRCPLSYASYELFDLKLLVSNCKHRPYTTKWVPLCYKTLNLCVVLHRPSEKLHHSCELGTVLHPRGEVAGKIKSEKVTKSKNECGEVRECPSGRNVRTGSLQRRQHWMFKGAPSHTPANTALWSSL